MKQFAELYSAMDSTTKINIKVSAMEKYLQAAPAADAAWAVYFLRGGKLRAPFPSKMMRGWAAEIAGVPAWLFAECYESVGDLAETAALLLPDAPEQDGLGSLTEWIESRLIPLRGMAEEDQRRLVVDSWQQLSSAQRFVWNKLITGSFRVGVSDGLVMRAIAAVSGLKVEVIAHRLAGSWKPSSEAWVSLLSQESSDLAQSQPYPFYLSHPLEGEPELLGNVNDWMIERKWDGIRAQMIRGGEDVHIWSRGGEILTERFVELMEQASHLPKGTVVDGEIVGWRDNKVLPFADLQHRITLKRPSRAILDKVPARLLAFDLLEWQGRDVRTLPLQERRALLETLPLHLSERLHPADWQAARQLRLGSREFLAEGLMLKRMDSEYGVGREKGRWWKWKVDPYSVDAVLIYAQRGHGRRASLYTDYTFGVWDKDKLVPFAKAYSGLTDAEIREVDSFIRSHTIEKFGPVCTVTPQLVFEIAFEGIQQSTRHKSGIAVRFPRMARRRTDKSPADADTIETVKALLLST